MLVVVFWRGPLRAPSVVLEVQPQESPTRIISRHTLATPLGAKWGLTRTGGDNRLVHKCLKMWSLSVLVGPGWDKCRGLKIRVSVVQIRPWAPFPMSCLAPLQRSRCEAELASPW